MGQLIYGTCFVVACLAGSVSAAQRKDLASLGNAGIGLGFSLVYLLNAVVALRYMRGN